MAIIRALPHSFDDVVRTISVLDKFDKPPVIQSLRNMDHTRANLSLLYHLCFRCVHWCAQAVTNRVHSTCIIFLSFLIPELAK